MLFNVSTLLSEPAGSIRTYEVQNEPARVPEEDYQRSVSGDLQLLRTSRGVLVHATVTVRPPLECARCLAPLERDLELDFDEEFVTETDPITGEPLEDIGPDDFRIKDHQHLDLSEAVRQYEQSTLPLRLTCRPECAGLCPHCGQDLNERACGCRQDEPDSRWSGLAALAERLRTEDRDGSAEA